MPAHRLKRCRRGGTVQRRLFARIGEHLPEDEVGGPQAGAENGAGSLDDLKLQGRAALVTGGARGIGECIVRLFAEEGAAVVIADVLREEGERVAAAIRDEGGRAVFQATDVTRADQTEAAAQRAVDEYGGLHVLVNDAGWMRPQVAVRVTEEEFDRTMAVNVKGTWLVAKYAIPHMIQAGGGSIVNISFADGHRRVPGRVAYAG